ncbi:MAG: peptide-methionine (R)-S-oxide reductase MsrB [Patescibacteria group bacterium]
MKQEFSDFSKEENLTQEEYQVIREKGTEAPFSGKYWDEHGKGMYRCRACGLELFSSDTKFDSGSGWPSFTDPVNREHVELKNDESLGMARTEVVCKRCGAHLGHLFEDGPKDKGGKRFCINSVSLTLEKSPVEPDPPSAEK